MDRPGTRSSRGQAPTRPSPRPAGLIPPGYLVDRSPAARPRTTTTSIRGSGPATGPIKKAPKLDGPNRRHSARRPRRRSSTTPGLRPPLSTPLYDPGVHPPAARPRVDLAPARHQPPGSRLLMATLLDYPVDRSPVARPRTDSRPAAPTDARAKWTGLAPAALAARHPPDPARPPRGSYHPATRATARLRHDLART